MRWPKALQIQIYKNLKQFTPSNSPSNCQSLACVIINAPFLIFVCINYTHFILLIKIWMSVSKISQDTWNIYQRGSEYSFRKSLNPLQCVPTLICTCKLACVTLTWQAYRVIDRKLIGIDADRLTIAIRFLKWLLKVS